MCADLYPDGEGWEGLPFRSPTSYPSRGGT